MVDLRRPVKRILPLFAPGRDYRPGSHYHGLLLPLVLVLLMAPPEMIDQFSQQARHLQAFGVIDGERQPVQVGTVIAEGRLVGEGENQYCDLPSTSYGLSGSTTGQASLVLEVTSDCQLIVAAIDAAPAAADAESGSMKSYAPSDDGERTFETHGADGS